MHAPSAARPPARTVVVLGGLTMFGPLSLDLYLPALPQLADDLGTSASAAQLSITTCLVGLAVGQLVAGPLSDRFGRKRPLIIGLVAYVLASVACALAPTATALIALRLVQGLGGAAGSALSSGLAGATMFAYISGSTFVLQRIYGMSPQGFSFVFGGISLGMVITAQAGARLALIWPLTRVLSLGLMINLVGAAAVLVTVISGFPLPVLVGALIVMVCAVGLIFPTANALAMADYPDLAGTASSLQGLSQFVFGAVAAPLVGIAGEQTALPLGIVTTAVSLCALTSFTSLVLPVVRARVRSH